MKRTIYTIVLIAISIALNAQHDAHHDSHHDKEHHKDHHSDHQIHKHHIAIFGGAGTNFKHHTTEPAMGIDYEYRINNLVGLGGVAEVEFASDPAYLVSIPLFFHPANGLKIYAGPAIASTFQHHASTPNDLHAGDQIEAERELQFGGRIGAAYDFTFGKITVGPTVNCAFAKTTALIYGINFGIGF